MPTLPRAALALAAAAAAMLLAVALAYTEINAEDPAAPTAAESPCRAARTSPEDHRRRRAEMIADEQALAVGGALALDAVELRANDTLMRLKRREIDEGLRNASAFHPAHHFFERRALIERSDVFRAIRRMPKAAALHAHDTALVGGDYLVKNVTYMPHLYVRLLDDGGDDESEIELRFARAAPLQGDGSPWQLLADVRANSGDVAEFDRRLGERFTMFVDDPAAKYPNADAAWSAFSAIFGRITPMLTYVPVWEEYFYEALAQFRADGVFYVEVRTTLPDLYDLDGNAYGPIECARAYKRVNDRFRRDYPDSFGARFIYAPMRLVSRQRVAEYVDTAVRLRAEFGDFFAGFDLVGHEDEGRPLVDFLDELARLPASVPVYYHSGETNWYGTSTDENLVDALLFGARRLGHAYALLKHPEVERAALKLGVALEINPISNQVLRLVDDMRNHPAAAMLAAGHAVVVSSDDPGLWGGLPMSHDLYAAFVGVASARADLRTLKQLALNTIAHSAMPPEERLEAVRAWTRQWRAFVEELAEERAEEAQ